jgi:hypothetical protein
MIKPWFLTEGKACCYIHHTLLLGFSNWPVIYSASSVSKKYNLGALIARRLAARGPIFGGIIAARIVAALRLPIAPHDILLTP